MPFEASLSSNSQSHNEQLHKTEQLHNMSIPDIPDIAVPMVSEVVADVEFPDAKRMKSSNDFHMTFWDDTDSEFEDVNQYHQHRHNIPA